MAEEVDEALAVAKAETTRLAGSGSSSGSSAFELAPAFAPAGGRVSGWGAVWLEVCVGRRVSPACWWRSAKACQVSGAIVSRAIVSRAIVSRAIVSRARRPGKAGLSKQAHTRVGTLLGKFLAIVSD